MMMPRELEEFFGADVLVQFREAVCLAESTGTMKAYAQVRASGELVRNDLDKVVTQSRLVPDRATGEDTFTLLLQCKLLPMAGERVAVLYETKDGCLARVAVRASDILAVTWIEGRIGRE